jgi:glycosyltransferase involved in cell wall biosynthesis
MPQPILPSYLACLGRISPEKGIDRAVRIAARCGLPLKIAAMIDHADQDYFDEQIRPLLALRHVEYVGEISDREKAEFLSGAVALLMPIDWPEPFGLVMVEAMACGTPSIAFDWGSAREIIDHGQTGFIVKEEAGAVEAVRQIEELSRARIRRCFEEHFTVRRMANDYLMVYENLIEAAKPVSRPPARRVAMDSRVLARRHN